MDFSEPPTGRPSPRRELQGPRPTPLKVNKDSYKIKKPPVAPPPSHPPLPPAQPPHGHRPPVIIYTVSPKVIHTQPSDFMALVQRLTGFSSSSSSASVPSPSAGGALSPAARLATIEKSTHASDAVDRSRKYVDLIDEIEIDVAGGGGAGAATTLDRASSFPGILSPMPSALPPISPGFFSPSVDPNMLSFLHELSPAFHGNKSYIESTFLVSPHTTFLPTPTMPSPGAWDLFSQFQDF